MTRTKRRNLHHHHHRKQDDVYHYYFQNNANNTRKKVSWICRLLLVLAVFVGFQILTSLQQVTSANDWKVGVGDYYYLGVVGATSSSSKPADSSSSSHHSSSTTTTTTSSSSHSLPPTVLNEDSKNGKQQQQQQILDDDKNNNNRRQRQQFLSPQESAQFVKDCMDRHNILWRDNPGIISDWAGNLVYPTATKKRWEVIQEGIVNETTSIILGPIIPKSGSTTLRLLGGNKDRPRGLRNRYVPKPHNSFQVAVVRHPIDHFLSIYRQIGSGNWRTIKDGPIQFCKATEKEHEQWFSRMVHNFIKPYRISPNRNEHLLSQLHYLQNYHYNTTTDNNVTEGSSNQQQQQQQHKVPVLDRIDALLHLEDWDVGWELATEQSIQFSKEAHSWMESHKMMTNHSSSNNNKQQPEERNPLPNDYTKMMQRQYTAEDTGWKPLCGEDGSVPYFHYQNITVTITTLLNNNNNNKTTRSNNNVETIGSNKLEEEENNNNNNNGDNVGVGEVLVNKNEQQQQEQQIIKEEVVVVDGKGDRLESIDDYLAALHLLRYNYGRKYLWKYVPILCEYLKLDFECLQYDLPMVCQSNNKA